MSVMMRKPATNSPVANQSKATITTLVIVVGILSMACEWRWNYVGSPSGERVSLWWYVAYSTLLAGLAVGEVALKREPRVLHPVHSAFLGSVCVVAIVFAAAFIPILPISIFAVVMGIGVCGLSPYMCLAVLTGQIRKLITLPDEPEGRIRVLAPLAFGALTAAFLLGWLWSASPLSLMGGGD